MKLSKLQDELEKYMREAFEGERWRDVSVQRLLDTLAEDIMGTEGNRCGNCGRPATRTIGDVHRCERCADL